ncbi:CpaF family protein, partial [Burkholderia pseudomallei]|nr:CpaF family protein [Burkholderia pseudomallei]MBF3850843.1 CpaF family protein [Burkholderia pseudomallei]MBF3912891.1 CpaF family protein [Burkholderia pseudomallei]
MSLRDQMSVRRAQPLMTRSDAIGAANAMAREAYQKLRRQMHGAVLERVELERLSRLPAEQVR